MNAASDLLVNGMRKLHRKERWKSLVMADRDIKSSKPKLKEKRGKQHASKSQSWFNVAQDIEKLHYDANFMTNQDLVTALADIFEKEAKRLRKIIR
jgi:hypothetical protein